MQKKADLLNYEQWRTQARIVAGIMSGTSLDGVDIAIARFSEHTGQHTLEQIAESTMPFSRQDYRFYKRLMEEPVSVSLFCDAAIHLMQLYESALRSCCDEYAIDIDTIDAVGIHGQTLWHSPNEHEIEGRMLRSTLQISSPSALAQMLGIPVVGDFRGADVAAGGQGAPLVPIFDQAFMAHSTEFSIALNIGGMANITLLPPGCVRSDVRAFDTGPGNVWIDATMMKYYGKRYDENGSTAAAGMIIPSMLQELQSLPYITAAPPKSTGRELFSGEHLEQLLRRHVPSIRPPEDAVATLCFFTAWSIAENIRRFGVEKARIIVSGGGAHNKTLLQFLAHELPNTSIMLSNDLGISADGKEALCFAYLAYRTLSGLTSNIPSVTGAIRECLLGVIALP